LIETKKKQFHNINFFFKKLLETIYSIKTRNCWISYLSKDQFLGLS